MMDQYHILNVAHSYAQCYPRSCIGLSDQTSDVKPRPTQASPAKTPIVAVTFGPIATTRQQYRLSVQPHNERQVSHVHPDLVLPSSFPRRIMSSCRVQRYSSTLRSQRAARCHSCRSSFTSVRGIATTAPRRRDADPRVRDLGREILDDYASIRESYGTECLLLPSLRMPLQLT